VVLRNRRGVGLDGLSAKRRDHILVPLGLHKNEYLWHRSQICNRCDIEWFGALITEEDGAHVITDQASVAFGSHHNGYVVNYYENPTKLP
jgi:hypothetical protein